MDTKVKVRAQANGGKFIGPSIPTPLCPILSVLAAGQPIIDPVTIPNGSSGTVVTQKGTSSSPYTIVVQPPAVRSEYYPKAGTYWLDPPSEEGLNDVIVTLSLDVSTDVEFQVEAFAPQPVRSSVTVRIEPGGSYTADPGIVVSVPGLYVPQFTPQYANGTVNVTATVQMMCGCPVTQQPASTAPTVEPYWPSPEFEVTAIFAPQRGPESRVTLACVGTDQFSGSLTLAPGTYACTLVAVQPSTGNSGSASAQLTVP